MPFYIRNEASHIDGLGGREVWTYALFYLQIHSIPSAIFKVPINVAVNHHQAGVLVPHPAGIIVWLNGF